MEKAWDILMVQNHSALQFFIIMLNCLLISRCQFILFVCWKLLAPPVLVFYLKNRSGRTYRIVRTYPKAYTELCKSESKEKLLNYHWMGVAYFFQAMTTSSILRKLHESLFTKAVWKKTLSRSEFLHLIPGIARVFPWKSSWKALQRFESMNHFFSISMCYVTMCNL